MLNPLVTKVITVNHPELGHIEVRVEGVVTEKSGVADFKVYHDYTDITKTAPAEVLAECMVQLGAK